MPADGPKLTPTDPDDKALMEKWLESGSMLLSDGMNWNGMSKRLGNLLGPMTMPIFAANVVHNFTIWNFLEAISMIPLVSNHTFIGMNFIFKLLGVEAFIKVKKFGDIISLCRRGLNHHFSQLTSDLEASGGPFICGSEYTLADVR